MLLQALNQFYERATKPDENGDVLIEEAAFNQKYARWIFRSNRMEYSKAAV